MPCSSTSRSCVGSSWNDYYDALNESRAERLNDNRHEAEARKTGGRRPEGGVGTTPGAGVRIAINLKLKASLRQF